MKRSFPKGESGIRVRSKIKKSISVATFPTKFGALVFTGDLREIIQKVSKVGYEGIELFIKRPEEINLESLGEWLDLYNIRISAIAAVAAFVEEGLSLSDPDKSIRKKHIEIMKRQIELASNFNAIVPVGLVRGKIREGYTREETEGWFAESLFECEKVARGFGVTLALEPLNRYETNFVNTLDEGIQFIKKIGFQNVKILADTFHMNIEEVSIPEAIIAARDYISHIHFADSNRCAPGDGHLNFPDIIDALMKISYKGFVAMEMLPKPDPVTAAERAMNYLEGLRI